MVYTLGTVTAAGSAPYYTNPALFNTTAPYNASAHHHHHPHNVTTTTVTVTVPYVVATGYNEPGDFTEKYTLEHPRLYSRSSSRAEVQQTATPMSNTQVNASGLKTAMLSGLAVSIFLLLALLVVFLLFYFQKLRCERQSRGDPEAPPDKLGFELTTLQKQYLSCGPSDGAVEPVVPQPSAPTTTKAPRAAKPVVTQPSAPAATKDPRPTQETPPATTQPSTQVACSIPLPPSPPLSPSPPKVSPVKPRRKTKTLAEGFDRPLSRPPVSPVEPRRKNKPLEWELDRALTRENSQTEDEDLDLPELQFASAPSHPVPSPVLSTPSSGFTRAVAKTWGPEGPSEEGKRFYKTVRQSKKKAKELQAEATQSTQKGAETEMDFHSVSELGKPLEGETR